MNSLPKLSPAENSFSKALREYNQSNFDQKSTEIASTRVFSLLKAIFCTPRDSKIALTSPLTDSNLKTAALHYLLKDAMFQGVPFPISLIGGFRAKNSGYVRTFGNGVTRAEEFLLQQRGNDFFRKSPNELFLCSFLVKSLKFQRVLKGEFNWTPIFEKDQIPDSFDERLEGFIQLIKDFKMNPKDPPFFDIGQIINPEIDLVDGNELMERFKKVRGTLQSLKLNPNFIFGGVVTFNDSKNQLAFILNPTGKAAQTLASKSMTFLSTAGYRPDIVASEHNLGFKIENYLDLFSIAPKKAVSEKVYTLELLQKLHKELQKEIENNLLDKSKAAQFYFSFFKNLHPHLGPESLALNDLKAIQVIGNAYENLLDQLRKPTQDYAALVVKIDLIFEEINIISRFNTSLDFEKQLKELAKTDTIPFTVTLHTSGMNVFSMLIPALHKALKGKKEPFTALIPESLYFEVGTCTSHLHKRMTATTYTNDFNPEKFDVVFMELHPNNVTKDYMCDLEVIKNIKKEKLAERKTALTVVLDTSTTLFYDKDVKDILLQYKKEIDDGKIAFVIVNSLEKLLQLSQSKYPGGIAAIYANDKHSPLSAIMTQYAKKEPLSREAQSFLKMFIFEEKWPLLYKEKLLENTNYFYKLAAERLTGFEGNSFEVIKKDSYKTPFLALHYQTFVKKILHQLKSKSLSYDETNLVKECTGKIISQYCGLLANLEGLFLARRMSFGFDHMNFLDCYTALRLSVGLEPEEILDKFIDLFTNLDQSLQVHPSQLKEYAEFIFAIALKEDYEDLLQEVIKKTPDSIEEIYQNSNDPTEIFTEFFNYLITTLDKKPNVTPHSSRGRGAPLRLGSSDPIRGRGRGRGENSATRGRGRGYDSPRGERGNSRSRPTRSFSRN